MFRFTFSLFLCDDVVYRPKLCTGVPNQRLKYWSHKITKSSCLIAAIKDLRLYLSSLWITHNLLDPKY